MLSDLAKFALEVVEKAGRVVLQFHERRMEPMWTDRTHFKTVADDASEAVIQAMVMDRFPCHNIWSEEGGLLDKGSSKTWVWDAVDGTIGLQTGTTDHFSVCGALCDGRKPMLGVINAVKRGELYVGECGRGAYCNGQPIRVSEETNINSVIMGVDGGKHHRDAHIPFLKRAYQPDGVTSCIATACASVLLALVARGAMHAYLATSLGPEDMAAAVPIIREAGGKVTNLTGKEWQLADTSILAANHALHQKFGQFFEIF